MALFRIKSRSRLVLLACGLFSVAATGCQLQSNIGGQALPSAYYLRDDVQYFPAGDEFLLPNKVRALEEFRLEQEALEEGFDRPVP